MVCADLHNKETVEREVRALMKAAEDYPHAKKLIITLMPEAATDIPEDIKVYSAAIWLLKEDLFDNT